MGMAASNSERFDTCSEIGCNEVVAHFVWSITYVRAVPDSVPDTELPVIVTAPAFD